MWKYVDQWSLWWLHYVDVNVVVLCNQTSTATRGWNFAKRALENKPTEKSCIDDVVISWKPLKNSSAEKKEPKQSPNPTSMEDRSSDLNLHGLGGFHGCSPRWSWLDSPKATSSAFSSRQQTWLFTGQHGDVWFFLSWCSILWGLKAPLFLLLQKSGLLALDCFL